MRPQNFPALPTVQPRPTAEIIAAIAKPLSEAVAYYSPEERKKRALEQQELSYKSAVIGRQMALLNNPNALNAVDSSGLPLYKPDGTPYTFAEHLTMKRQKQLIDITEKKAQENPNATFAQDPDYGSLFKQAFSGGQATAPSISGLPDYAVMPEVNP